MFFHLRGNFVVQKLKIENPCMRTKQRALTLFQLCNESIFQQTESFVQKTVKNWRHNKYTMVSFFSGFLILSTSKSAVYDVIILLRATKP